MGMKVEVENKTYRKLPTKVFWVATVIRVSGKLFYLVMVVLIS